MKSIESGLNGTISISLSLSHDRHVKQPNQKQTNKQNMRTAESCFKSTFLQHALLHNACAHTSSAILTPDWLCVKHGNGLVDEVLRCWRWNERVRKRTDELRRPRLQTYPLVPVICGREPLRRDKNIQVSVRVNAEYNQNWHERLFEVFVNPISWIWRQIWQ